MDPGYADTYADLYRRHWWWRARERVLLAEVRALVGPRARPRLLDVGCGAGLFFDELSAIGDVHGLEPDRAMVAQSGRWRDRITVARFDTTFSPGETYDVVLLLDVLEHLPMPGEALQMVSSLLAPHGVVLITVPAFRWLWTSHDELNQHQTRYSRGELVRLLERHGLEVVSARYLFASLVLPKLATRVFEAVCGARNAIPRVPPSFVNSTLRRWCELDAAAGRYLPLGSSVMAVARRSE